AGGDDVAVAGSTSNAPMSQSPADPPRGSPRWSVVAQASMPDPSAAGLPWSIAGLPGCRARVNVMPPVSWRGPSPAGTLVTSLPVIELKTQPEVLPIRLNPAEFSTSPTLKPLPQSAGTWEGEPD